MGTNFTSDEATKAKLDAQRKRLRELEKDTFIGYETYE